MSWTTTKTNKCCGNCANWGGSRNVVNRSSVVETSHADTRGKCYAGVFCSVSQGPRACDGKGCAKYQLWSAVK